MRAKFPEKLERGRILKGSYGSSPGKPYGAFTVIGPNSQSLAIVASDGNDPIAKEWEHVSVSLAHRCPNWQEMSFVKDLFWNEDETVVQFHPGKTDHINIHPNCLHLWKWCGGEFPMPPKILV